MKTIKEVLNNYDNYKTVLEDRFGIRFVEFLTIKEMKRISKNGGSELIVYLRDEERLPWKQICKVTHYSDKQVRRIYKKSRN